MKDIIIMTGYRVMSDAKDTPQKRTIGFHITKVSNDNTIQRKVWVTAFDGTYELCKRLKIRKGSIIDLTCEIWPGKDRDGNYVDWFKILSVNYAASYEYTPSSASESTPSPITMEETKPFKETTEPKGFFDTANMLATNPFGKKNA